MLNVLRINNYLTLCKPKVVLLMLLTAWVGMYLANPLYIQWRVVVLSTIGIACITSAAAVINHLMDRKIDSQMSRTAARPMAVGSITLLHASVFALILACTGWIILSRYVNMLTAVLAFAGLVGYAVIYTLYLKRATPQNIVIGGLSGAIPPLLGWAAISNSIHPNALLLTLIIFTWTPPHFWALAIYRANDYTVVNIPMLPVTHGIKFTKLNLLLYTLLLLPVTCLPFVVKLASYYYLMFALCLNSVFIWLAVCLYQAHADQEHRLAIKTFNFSIVYLLLLFIGLLLDKVYDIY